MKETAVTTPKAADRNGNLDIKTNSAMAERARPQPIARATTPRPDFQLREGGPRLRGRGAAESAAAQRRSGMRSAEVRTSRGMWKEWLKAGVTTCPNAGHSAQVASTTPPASTRISVEPELEK